MAGGIGVVEVVGDPFCVATALNALMFSTSGKIEEALGYSEDRTNQK
jgi:hypothetical protein